MTSRPTRRHAGRAMVLLMLLPISASCGLLEESAERCSIEGVDARLEIGASKTKLRLQGNSIGDVQTAMAVERGAMFSWPVEGGLVSVIVVPKAVAKVIVRDGETTQEAATSQCGDSDGRYASFVRKGLAATASVTGVDRDGAKVVGSENQLLTRPGVFGGLG
jgi:hypothetical protein